MDAIDLILGIVCIVFAIVFLAPALWVLAKTFLKETFHVETESCCLGDDDDEQMVCSSVLYCDLFEIEIEWDSWNNEDFCDEMGEFGYAPYEDVDVTEVESE